MYNTVFLNISVQRHELEFVSFEKKQNKWFSSRLGPIFL